MRVGLQTLLAWQMRSELQAFVDEQRVFCGFLDTEQRPETSWGSVAVPLAKPLLKTSRSAFWKIVVALGGLS